MFKLKNPAILHHLACTDDIDLIIKVETLAYAKDTGTTSPKVQQAQTKIYDNTLENHIILKSSKKPSELMAILKDINLKILLKQSFLKDFKI